MSLVPKDMQPILDIDGESISYAKRSGLKMDLNYGHFEHAIQVLKQPDEYVQGALRAYESLMVEPIPDIVAVVMTSQMHDARTSRGKSISYGDGALDMWRLLVEMSGDVGKVIQSQ